jgi:hypothetical protein
VAGALKCELGFLGYVIFVIHRLHFAMTNTSNATAWNLTAGVRQIYDATYAVCDPAALGGAMGSCRVITSNQRSGCFK